MLQVAAPRDLPANFERPRSHARGLYLLAAGFALAAVAALAIDLAVANFCLNDRLPGELRAMLSLAEVFAHGYGVAAILLAVYVLDKAQRWRLPRVAACAFVPGALNLLVKVVVARQRPHSLWIDGLPDSVSQTFVGLLPAMHDLRLIADRSLQSFTSGHATAAVGLAIGLSWLYPRGRWLFALFALLASLQRVAAGAHFLSDTLAAAMLAALVGGYLLSDAASRRVFGRLERTSSIATIGDASAREAA